MRTSIDLARVLSKFGRDGSGYHGDMLFPLNGASVVVEHVRIWRHCWRTRKQSCFGNCIGGREHTGPIILRWDTRTAEFVCERFAWPPRIRRRPRRRVQEALRRVNDERAISVLVPQ